MSPQPTAQSCSIPARRQVERRHQHDELPHARRTSSATSSIRPRSRSARRALPFPTPSAGRQSRLRGVQVGEGVAHADGLRRRQRRDGARVRRHRGERRQGNLGVHPGGDVHRGRSERLPRTRRRPAFQLGALAFRRGGIPLYSHKFYVNATPRDLGRRFRLHQHVDVSRRPGNDWRTIVVGGLGAGGRAVYALDVTNPVALPIPVAADADRRGRALWEFTDNNLGYVYDRRPSSRLMHTAGWCSSPRATTIPAARATSTS